MLINKNIMS